jgi:hypothetical protein
MRVSLSRLATTIGVTTIVACSTPPPPAVSPAAVSASPAAVAAATASATPGAPALATPAPTSSPRPTAWPREIEDQEPVIGADGTVYLLERARGTDRPAIVALDAGGRVKPGWPIVAPARADFGALAASPDGSVYLEEHASLEIGSVLHRLGADGRDLPGWPLAVPPAFACPAGAPYDTDDPRTPAVGDPCYPPGLDIGPDGTAYLTNYRPAGPRLLAVDPSARIRTGWPIDLDKQDWSDLHAGPDGVVYLVRRPVGTPTFDPVRGVIDEDAQLWAFGPNGSVRPGWPVAVPNIRRFQVDPRGNVVIYSLIDDVGELCPFPARTLFSILGPDGRSLPGWPRGSKGFASFPVVTADGTAYYVSATSKLYAHDAAGEVKAGWPVAVPGAGSGCGPESPALAPDGTVHVIGDEITARSPDGSVPSGWPYRPSGTTTGPCLDSECFGGHGAPAIGPDGTVYLIVYHAEPSGTRAEIVAVDRAGQLRPGWPYRLPFDAKTVGFGPLTVSPDGRLIVRVGSTPNVLLALDPDGTLAA